MDYKKMWNTLKAESGYRVTKNFANKDDVTLRELMERQERISKRLDSESLGKQKIEENDMLADRYGNIWIVKKTYEKPSALFKCIAGEFIDDHVVDEIDNLKSLKTKKIN